MPAQTGPPSEIGRELKVSELQPHVVVVIIKPGFPVAATVWVAEIRAEWVVFWAGDLRTMFIARRFGKDLEHIVEQTTGRPMEIHEYLGEI